MHIRPLTNRQFSANCLGLAAACAALLLAPLPSLALQYDGGTELTPSDGEWLRTPIAISGYFSIAGAWQYGDPGTPGIPGIPGTGTPDLSSSGAAYIFEQMAGGAVVEHQLIPPDPRQGASFGYSVAISGEVAVMGAPYDEESANSQNSGSAYVYRYNEGTWEFEEKLIPDDVLKGDGFGYSVAISDDVILVGSPKSFGSTRAGAVYVFRYASGNWTEEDQFSSFAPALDDDFGEIIAVSGDSAVVGNGGAAYLFRNNAGTWSEEEELSAPVDAGATSGFGTSVDVLGDRLLVGAYNAYDEEAENNLGAAYVYQYDNAGSWDKTAKLTGDGLGYSTNFGRSVALSDDNAVIGARGGNLSPGAGLAQVFWYDGASWIREDPLIGPGSSSADMNFGISADISGVTVLVAGYHTAGIFLFKNIVDTEFFAYDNPPLNSSFGESVAISGDTALIGAPTDDHTVGSAYLSWYDGENWYDEDKFIASEDVTDRATDDRFGTSVGLDGDIAIIGSPGSGRNDIEETQGTGAAYIFQFDGDAWTETDRLTAGDDADPEDIFGQSVAISGDTVVIGAPWDGWVEEPEWMYGAGAAYVFRYNGASWDFQGKLLPTGGGAEEDEFGRSVSISGDTIVVGAPFDDSDESDAGAAYVFERSGSTWTPLGKLTPTGVEADDEFGGSVAVSSDMIVVGAKRDGEIAANAGAAYVFTHDGENWVEEIKLTASDGMTVARFGFSVAISSQNTIAVGAEYDNSKGAAYIFWEDEISWVEEPKLLAPNPSNGDYFGGSIAISGDRVLVGAYGYPDNGAAFLSTVQYVNVPEPSLLALNLAALAALACVARRRASR